MSIRVFIKQVYLALAFVLFLLNAFPSDAFTSALNEVAHIALESKTPLILVHGLHGKEEGLEYWQKFVNYFNSMNSLTSKYKLYKFEYGTNVVDVNSIGLALANDINSWQEFKTNGIGEPVARKIVLLAHSLGGLVSRSYMQDHGGYERIMKLITLATPHHGTPGANDAPRVNMLAYNASDWIATLYAIDSVFWCKDPSWDINCFTSYFYITEPNRKDLLWDSYDSPSGATGYNNCPECNPWLQGLNLKSGNYNNKLILYFGYLNSISSTIYAYIADLAPSALLAYMVANYQNKHKCLLI